MTEDQIEVLTFQNDKSEYTIAISTGISKHEECLKLTGSVNENWRVPGDFQIEPLLKGLKCGDRMNIRCAEDGALVVKLVKCLDSKFSMEGIDKNATRGIALDIIGSIINS